MKIAITIALFPFMLVFVLIAFALFFIIAPFGLAMGIVQAMKELSGPGY